VRMFGGGARGFGAALSMLLLAAAPCLADWQDGAGADWQRLLAAARNEGKVVVGGGPDLAKTFSDGFRRDTGISVEFLAAPYRELSARLNREARAGQVTMDVVFGGYSDVALVRSGHMNPIKPQLLLPGVTDPNNWAGGHIKWIDKDQAYMLQGSEYVDAIPLLNTDLVKPGEITTWRDMAKPQYKGKIAAFDPRGPGPGAPVAGYLMELFGVEYLKDFYIGQNITLTRDARQLVEWAARGIYPVALGTTVVDVEQFLKSGMKNIEPVAMADGAGIVLGAISVVSQPKGGPHPNAAAVFLNWYASKPGQEAYVAGKRTPSRRTDVAPPDIPAVYLPRTGVAYPDQYSEDYFFETVPKFRKALIDAFGGE
jgi:ABC-type Fe3+ transport system substrate-binding protein